MEVISKIILGIIQGITEMLPVSSSGHLILAGKLLDFDIDLPFLTFLHFMTALAIFFGFWTEIKYIFLSKNRRNLIKILFIGIIPAGISGILFYDNISVFHTNATLMVFNLISIGLVMILVDTFFSNKVQIKKLDNIKTNNALLIGLSQIIALLPGVSRSGITITSAIFTGINKNTAIAFSFLIALPLLILSFFFEIVKNVENINIIFKAENLLGGLATFIFGYFSVLILKKLANTSFLTVFGIYRILLGIVLIFILIR